MPLKVPGPQQVLDHLLAWCYADTFRDLDLPSSMELFRAAECYEIQGLLTKCGQRISKIMTVTWHTQISKDGWWKWMGGWVGMIPSMGIREMGMIWGVILGSWPRVWEDGFLLCYKFRSWLASLSIEILRCYEFAGANERPSSSPPKYDGEPCLPENI